MITVQTYIPGQLSAFVKSFWCLKVADHLSLPYTEDILPDGHPEIIFQLQPSSRRKISGEEEWQNDPVIFFAGQKRKSYRQQFETGTIIYGIRFYPHTLSLLYNFPASLLTDNPVEIDAVAPADELKHCIALTSQQTFMRFEKVLTKKISRLKKSNDAFLYVDAAISRIMQQKGIIKMDLLEKVTGVSTRYLEKSFQTFVGISPKQFGNIIRYNHFIVYKKNNPGKTLTECAYESEFCDQSHLIRLSTLITGQSPKAYFSKPNYINDFFLIS